MASNSPSSSSFARVGLDACVMSEQDQEESNADVANSEAQDAVNVASADGSSQDQPEELQDPSENQGQPLQQSQSEEQDQHEEPENGNENEGEYTKDGQEGEPTVTLPLLPNDPQYSIDESAINALLNDSHSKSTSSKNLAVEQEEEEEKPGEEYVSFGLEPEMAQEFAEASPNEPQEQIDEDEEEEDDDDALMDPENV